jgi:N-methylhydantoinase B
LSSDRHRVPPWGIDGGHSAGLGKCRLITPDGKTEHLPSKVTRAVPKGGLLISMTPGGGGWGEPAKRDREALARDVEGGLISAARAAAAYQNDAAPLVAAGLHALTKGDK